MIAADMLAERLQRYQFVRDLAKNVQAYSFETETTTSTKSRIGVVNEQYARDTPDVTFKALTAQHPFEFIKVNTDRKKIDGDNRRSELVMIGDSENHSAVYGSGWPAIAMAKIGGSFRWGSRSGRY